MDKQKQIEEMAKDLKEEKLYALINKTNYMRSAENLYDLGYRKIPENAVVLTEEELEHRAYVNAMENELCKKCRDRIAKETVPVAMYELAKAFHDEKCAEFEKLCYDYNKLKTELEQTIKATAEKFAEMVDETIAKRQGERDGYEAYRIDDKATYDGDIISLALYEICKEITEGK